MQTQSYPRQSASMGLQNASSFGLRKANEIEDGRNIRFNELIGAHVRRNGYLIEGSQFSTTGKVPQGGFTANFTTGSKRFVAVNNDAGTFMLVRHQNNDGSWTTDITDIPVDSDVYFKIYRDEVYVSGYQKSTGIPFQPYNINNALNVSQTRNLLFAPYPYYFETYRGVLYAGNVSVGGVRYPDRFYKASAPTGAFTFVQGAQTNVPASVDLVNNIPTMTAATSPAGTASASTTSGTLSAWKAMDGNLGTYWEATATSGTLTYDFGSGVTPIAIYYSVTGGNASDLTKAPKTWIFQGSNNGTTWTDLDTQTNVPAFATAEQRYYSFSNTTAYRYYQLNVSANQGNATNLNVIELGIYTSQSGVKPFQLQLDSVRYAKAGMNVDIYKAGTTTLLYTINIYSVDKPNNIIQFLPLNWTISGVNTTTDVLTISSTTSIPTGTPINFSATTSLPAPLATNTQYYAINLTSTTFKVATSRANALIGQAIDITTAGSGTNTINLSYTVNNNDEVYLSGTYGKLTTLWNTDYPTADKADWSAVQSGVDSSMAITGMKESNNRLFVFTMNSSSKFDGNTTIPFNSTVGCVSQRVLCNIDDDWLVWLSARGRVYARSESSGQQQYISRGIDNKLFSKIPKSQLVTDAHANATDGEYVLFVGTFGGEPTRAVYDFGSNTWSIDVIHHTPRMMINDVPATGANAGFIRPFFFATDGYLYQDDIGDFDGLDANGKQYPIRFEARYGKTNYGSENYKKFIGAFIYSENAQGLKLYGAVDNKPPKIIGEISKPFGSSVEYPLKGDNILDEGTVIDLTIKGAINGPAQIIHSIFDYYQFVETKAGYGKNTDL